MLLSSCRAVVLGDFRLGWMLRLLTQLGELYSFCVFYTLSTSLAIIAIPENTWGFLGAAL